MRHLKQNVTKNKPFAILKLQRICFFMRVFFKNTYQENYTQPCRLFLWF